MAYNPANQNTTDSPKPEPAVLVSSSLRYVFVEWWILSRTIPFHLQIYTQKEGQLENGIRRSSSVSFSSLAALLPAPDVSIRFDPALSKNTTVHVVNELSYVFSPFVLDPYEEPASRINLNSRTMDNLVNSRARFRFRTRRLLFANRNNVPVLTFHFGKAFFYSFKLK